MGHSALSATSDGAEPLTITGRTSPDGETGLQYLRARYYDPTSAQFITRDPIVSRTQEPYGYAGNDPVNMVDPTGLFRIPGTNWCVDVADPNCNSIKEQHQEGAQQIANVAGGVVKGIGLGNGDALLPGAVGSKRFTFTMFACSPTFHLSG